MQIEKKLVLCSILAITIGIATVVPLAFFMKPTVASAQTTDDPWFNINVSYATCEAKMVFSNLAAMYTYVYNYTVNPDAIDTQIGARTEYFRIQIYTDQEQLVNKSVAIVANSSEIYDPRDTQFARPNWFNTSGVSASNIDFISDFNGTLQPDIGYQANCYATEEDAQIKAIQNAQTIYIDIHRVGYITFTGNDTVVSLANDEIVQHYELTKNGDGFFYGIRPTGYAADQIPGQIP